VKDIAGDTLLKDSPESWEPCVLLASKLLFLPVKDFTGVFSDIPKTVVTGCL